MSRLIVLANAVRAVMKACSHPDRAALAEALLEHRSINPFAVVLGVRDVDQHAFIHRRGFDCLPLSHKSRFVTGNYCFYLFTRV